MIEPAGDAKEDYAASHGPARPAALTVLHVADMLEGGGAEVMFAATVQASRNLGIASTVHVAEKTPSPIGYVFSFREARRLLAVLRAAKPDVVHFQNYYHRLTPSVLWAVRRYRKQTGAAIAVVFTAHDYHLACPNSVMQYFVSSEARNVPVEERPVRLLRRYDRRSIVHAVLKVAQWVVGYRMLHLERELDVIIAPSEFVADTLSDRTPAKTVVVRNVIDVDDENHQHIASADPPAPSAPMRLAYVGRIEADKGVDVLMDTFAALPLGGYRLDVYGDGSLRPALQRRAEANDWGRAVEFHGWVDAARVWAEVADADAVVVPSTCYETASLSMLEAAAVGIPTLGNRIGALVESSALSAVSAVCDMKDPAAVQSALAELRGRRGRNALRHPEDYTPAAYRASLKGVYVNAAAAAATTR